MKNNLLKYYIVAFYIFSTFVMVAQPGDDTSTPGGLETDGDTTPGAPIDDYVWVMAGIGLLFVFLKFRAMRKQVANSQG